MTNSWHWRDAKYVPSQQKVPLRSGQVGIVIPFVYYRFLGLRYASRRNPYTRLLFSELRRSVEHLAGHPRCPSSVQSLVFKFTSFIANLAPAVTTVPPPQATS
ncbi:Transmembrane protein 33 [Acropora cervicornis]|uniref:Transmembrane protein 33 n=1 Tax=Acropora cervicornis TaxID=6130 RepID=A0AAD9Q2E7_ACRCE|nr:Transmembrane protein 33 [Acropora cervicornis]